MQEGSIFERHVVGFGKLVICHYQKQIPFPLVLDVGNKLEGVDDLFVVQKGAVEFSASGKACGVCLLSQRFHIDDLPLKECSNSEKQDQIKISFQGSLYLHQVNIRLGKMPLNITEALIHRFGAKIIGNLQSLLVNRHQIPGLYTSWH